MNIGFRRPSTVFGWFRILRQNFPHWYEASSRTLAHPKPWPERFNPQTDPVFAYNEIFIPTVPLAIVFDTLITAPQWPSFYPNSGDVVLTNGDKLHAGMAFQWTTFATCQSSNVELYEQEQALGWSAESCAVHAFHRWILEPLNSGTKLITEECQNGFGAMLVKRWMNPSLHASHQLWLEQLKTKILQEMNAIPDKS